MASITQEIPNTRHVPQPNDDSDFCDGIPNTSDLGSQVGYDSLKRRPGLAYGANKSAIPNVSDPILDAIDRINGGDGSGSVTDGDGNAVLDGQDRFLKELGVMQGLNTNFSHSNKWVGYFPLANVLGKKYSNLELNLTRFAIPQIVMGSTTTSFKGYSVELPTKVLDADSKEIVLEYIVDEKWQNYKALYKWCSATEGQVNRMTDVSDVNRIALTDFVDCRIWLIDSFKNRIIDFVFENCWVRSFQELSLEADNPDEVHHTVTLAYSNFYIDNGDGK